MPEGDEPRKGSVERLRREFDRVTLPDGEGSADAPVTLGRFQLGEHLGSGGMGTVFEARDTTLNRTVAIKILKTGSGGEKARARLLREAQALARLKHPNVVTVFEVGLAGDEVFVAMELVAGGTLRDWMGRPHGWREIVDLFLALGRGLSAAHALDLVHRDVKPANVFLDPDGTPKLGDFGLVSAPGAPSSPDEPDASPDSPVSPESLRTTAGKVMGTPAYMAPEQLQGQPADARADQFAYCASLHEALTGTLPKRDGAAAQLPLRLRRILDKGLSQDAGARYPSMDALLAELQQVRRGRKRLWIALASTAVVAGVAGSTWAVSRARDLCPPPLARLDAVWGPARQAAVREHLLAVDKEQGANRFAAAAAWFDPVAAGLVDQHVEACRATRMRGTQSDTLLDLRMRCLDRRFTELEESVNVLASVSTTETLDRAVAGASQLVPLTGCADTAALSLAAPPPDRPEVRAKTEALADEIQKVAVRQRSGELKDLPTVARRLVEEARGLDHPPSLTLALTALGKVQIAVGDYEAAAATLRELTQVAARAHDDRTQAFAWTYILKITAANLLKPEQALELLPVATAAVVRAGEAPDQRADLLFAHATALAQLGPRGREALELFDQARTILENAGAKKHGSPLGPLLADVFLHTADTLADLGEGEKAAASYKSAIDAYRELYGPDSPIEAFAWHNLGEGQRGKGKPEEALESYRHAAHIREQRLGTSTLLADDYQGIGMSLGELKRWDQSLEPIEQALRMDRAHLGADSPGLLPVMIAKARVLVHLGRLDEGLRGYDDVIAVMDKNHLTTFNLAISLYNRAELQTQLKHYDQALAGYARAVGAFEASKGKEHGVLVYPLSGQGRCLVLAGQPAAAVPVLQRAVKLTPPGSAKSAAAQAKFYLARAQVETGRDRARNLLAAKAARAEAVAAGTDADDLVEIDRWLLAHR
jgi:tetratricopeptide (TPR) repeat protein